MRILLAEDDEKMNEMLVYSLTKAGFIVDSCMDGDDALFYGEQDIYDVILLDRLLPHMEGTDVLASLRKKDITTPVIPFSVEVLGKFRSFCSVLSYRSS